jgi:hypothetical protein
MAGGNRADGADLARSGPAPARSAVAIAVLLAIAVRQGICGVRPGKK